MPTILVDTIITDAARLLKDPNKVRWVQAEHLANLDAAHRDVVLAKPEAYSKTLAVLLTAGVTKQTLPADALGALEFVRNMGADGATPGDIIEIIDRQTLDRRLPAWHSAANAAGKIKHVVYDPKVDPKTYYVFPKAPATAWNIEIVYPAMPPACVAGGANKIQIDDIYYTPLLENMLWRAYMKDFEGGNVALGNTHFNAFAVAVGLKDTGDQARNPNNRTT